MPHGQHHPPLPTPAGAAPSSLIDALVVQGASLLIVAADLEGRYVRFNRACEEATGHTFAEVHGRRIWEVLIDPDDAPRIQTLFGRVTAGQSIPPFECDWFARDGTTRRIVWSGAAVRDETGVALVIGFGSDITEHHRAEQRFRESEERYALAVRGANDGIWDWDLKADRFYRSARWRAILGLDELPESSGSEDWFARVHPEDLPRLREAIQQHLGGNTPHIELEHRLQHRNGLWRWVLVRGLAIRDVSGRPYRMAGSLTDITDRKAVEEQLVRGALLDALTGLANRVLIENRLEHALARARRCPEYQFAVLFMDLDRFKLINDGLGHLVGDQLLIEFSRRLMACIRPSDTVARMGGDEFAILLEDFEDPADTTRVARRIQELLAEPFRLGEHEVFTTASIGIAPGSGRYRSVTELFRDADAAMYRAKAQGKARYELFDEAMHERAIETLKLENDLRRALDRGEFELHYQPVVNLSDLRLAGFEALVRWRHPDRGLVSPSAFIPVLEETGLIVPLGEWILREALRQTGIWRQQFPALAHARISVNVSGKQIMRSDLGALAREALADAGLPADALVIEITESVMVDRADQAVEVLERLRRQGVHLHVDDFGVGYSSLSQLHRFPINGLKIDRSFVSRIGVDAQAREAEIIRTIVAMARNLNLYATAEGIETPLQLQRLRSLGCELAQGYLFSKPLHVRDVTAMLGGDLPWLRARATA